MGFVHLVFGHDYKGLGEYRLSLNHYFKSRQIFPNDSINYSYTNQCIGEVYLKMNQLDSALIFTQQAYKLAIAIPDYGIMLYSIRILGDIFLYEGRL